MGEMMKLQKTINKLPVKGLCAGYVQDIKTFHKFVGDRSINQDIVFDYFKDMLSKGRKLATIQRHKSAIKKSLLIAIGENSTILERAQIDKFFKEIKAGKRDLAITKDKILSKQELKMLYNAAGHKTTLIIKALFETAARVSELCNIRIADCQQSGTGVIIKTIGKGKKERKFYMTTELYSEIRKAYKSDVWLFGNGKPLSRMTAYTLIKRAHTWASLSIQSLGLSKVSAYLAHADTSTTAKYYLHGKPEMADILSINQLNQNV
jgi:integrase